MEIVNGKNVTTMEELSNILKEIYDLTTHKKMTQRNIREKYGMPMFAIRDLKEIDKKYLEPDQLSQIVEMLKNNKRSNVGRDLVIGNNILEFISNRAGIVKEKKVNDKKEHYKKFYKEAQSIWTRVVNGDNIKDIANDAGLNQNDTEEIVYRYSELLKRLQEEYEWNHRDYTLKRYKENYFLNDDTLEYIKEFKKNENVDKVVENFLRRKGIIMQSNEGGEHEQ